MKDLGNGIHNWLIPISLIECFESINRGENWLCCDRFSFGEVMICIMCFKVDQFTRNVIEVALW